MRRNTFTSNLLFYVVLFSPWLRICSWLELKGKGMASYVLSVREELWQGFYVHVCVAPLMIWVCG